MFLLLLSTLVYLELGTTGTVFGLAIGAILATPSIMSTFKLYATTKNLVFSHNFSRKQEEERSAQDISERDYLREEHESEGVYFVQERFRISKPTEIFCWIMFTLEVGIFFFYPLASLFVIGNYPLGVVFLLSAGISGLPYYVNAAVVLEETGHMDLVGGDTERARWNNQARLNEILGYVTQGRSREAWMAVLGTVGFVFLGLMLGSIGTDQEKHGDDPPYVYLADFEYVQADYLQYPTCQRSSGLGGGPLKTLAGTSFLLQIFFSVLE